ncbi:MAG: histidine phosphatase family protein [Clostridia bacterium]
MAAQAPLTVLMVRHGESEANAIGRFAFRSWDPGLTERGAEQARQLVFELAGVNVAGVVSSPLRRAIDTVTPLAEARHLSVEIVPELAELDMGSWDGQALKEVAQNDPTAWRAWRRDPEKNPPPRGERISQAGQRVLQGLDRLRGRQGLYVAATHADCVKGAVLAVTGGYGPQARRLFVPNAGQILLRATEMGWLMVLPRVRL